MEDLINNTLQAPTEYKLFSLFHILKKNGQTTKEFEDLLIEIHGEKINSLIDEVNRLVDKSTFISE